MAEFNQQFNSFDEWVNKASSWLTRRGPHVRAICYDTKGRGCRIGQDFMLAKADEAFPVKWVWPDQVVERIVALQNALTNLVNAKALAGVREQVAGWNGENLPEPHTSRHPDTLGADLPHTNCGAVYALDGAMVAARALLEQAQ